MSESYRITKKPSSQKKSLLFHKVSTRNTIKILAFPAIHAFPTTTTLPIILPCFSFRRSRYNVCDCVWEKFL